MDLLIAADLARNVTLGPVAQWITRLTTNQEIAGSTPARVVACFLYISHLQTKQILKVRISPDDVVIVH